jgi:hypothetical protein
VGIEIAALSALAAISAQMGRKVYFPFGIVTFIQFLGNIFFAYQFIDIGSESFRDWVDLVDPIVSFIGVESGDYISHKRFLALFAGGMLPIISLSFLHMLVKFEEDEKTKTSKITKEVIDTDNTEVLDDQEVKFSPSEEDLGKLEKFLNEMNEKKFQSLETTENNIEESKIESEVPSTPEKPKINRLFYTKQNG